jgi:flagellar hook protein FlgE
MANPLMTGVSGLTSHQKMIEIVGNNLANLNTIGFKARSPVFSDVLYETLRGASGGGGGIGGTNPIQVGTGSQLSSINSNFSQGNLLATGAQFDMAIDGNGFFVVNSGGEDLFTRAGAFHLDRNGILVDSGTGFPVQRFGSVGDPDGVNPSFQTPGNSSIRVPLGAAVPGQATSEVTVQGNLAVSSTSATVQTLETSGPLTTGGTAATAGTLLNDLDWATTPYQAGDEIEVTGTDADGSSISGTVPVDGTTTVGDLVSALGGLFGQGTVSLAADGTLQLTADEAGESFLSLSLADAAGNTGESDFASAPFLVTQSGEDGTTVNGGMTVIDERGSVHAVNLQFEKQADETWTLTAAMDPENGTILDGEVTGITFDSSGVFLGVQGSDTMTFQFANQDDPQTVKINLGEVGEHADLVFRLLLVHHAAGRVSQRRADLGPYRRERHHRGSCQQRTEVCAGPTGGRFVSEPTRTGEPGGQLLPAQCQQRRPPDRHRRREGERADPFRTTRTVQR